MTHNLILSKERFVVESPEVRYLSLVWSLWRVAKHITVSVVPTVVVVLRASIFIVEDMNEAIVLFWKSLELLKTFNLIITMVKTWGNNQGFVGVLSSIRENDLVLIWLVLNNPSTDISP